SPVLDAGSNSAPNLPATDLDGNPRIADDNSDGVATADVGAYEGAFDYMLGAASPNTVMMVAGGISGPISLTLQGTRTFARTVTLSCSGLPANADCQFSPSATIQLNGTSPAALTLTIVTQATTPAGISTVTISAAAAGFASNKTQNLTLSVSGGGPVTDVAISASGHNPALIMVGGMAA